MVLSMFLWFVAAVVAGAVGGAATGVKIGGAAMGNEVAALMGTFFGLAAVVPAALVSIFVHAFR